MNKNLVIIIITIFFIVYFLNSAPWSNPLMPYHHTRRYVGKVKAVIFDWAGTVVDCGVFAPAYTFVEIFKGEGVAITDEEARGPMGTHKKVGYPPSRNKSIRNVI